MNILAISPHQSTTQIGLYSREMMDYCFGNSNVNLTLQNLTLSGQGNDSNTHNKYSRVYSEYDYIIQHCPYEYLAYIPNLKNIWIPIISNLSQIDDPYLNEYIENISMICTENKFTEMVLAKSIKETNKIKNFHFQINTIENDQQHKINFGKYNSAHKYYAILNFNQDQLCLLNLVKSFACIFRNCPDHCLMILLSCSPQQYASIEKTMTQLASEIRLKQISNIIIYSTQNILIQDTLPLHNSCDTFIDIEHNTENIHKYFAKSFGSNIIDRIDTDFSDAYGYRSSSCFDYKNQTYSMLSDGFDKIFNIRETRKYNTEPELMEILSEN